MWIDIVYCMHCVEFQLRNEWDSPVFLKFKIKFIMYGILCPNSWENGKSKNSSCISFHLIINIFSFHNRYSRIFLRGHCRHVFLSYSCPCTCQMFTISTFYMLFLYFREIKIKRNRNMIYFILLILHFLILMFIISSTFFCLHEPFSERCPMLLSFMHVGCRYMFISNFNGIFVNACYFVSRIVPFHSFQYCVLEYFCVFTQIHKNVHCSLWF